MHGLTNTITLTANTMALVHYSYTDGLFCVYTDKGIIGKFRFWTDAHNCAEDYNELHR